MSLLSSGPRAKVEQGLKSTAVYLRSFSSGDMVTVVIRHLVHSFVVWQSTMMKENTHYYVCVT